MKYVELIAAAGILLSTAKWAFFPFIPWSRLPRHRVRYMRLRLHLRLHPGPGHASIGELWLRWGRLAVFRTSGRSRRSLSFRQRAVSLVSAYSILIGRAHYQHALRTPLDEHVIVISPPRAGKTGWLASVVLRYPGSVVSTTTKHDMFALTSGVRAKRGPVHVFNPQNIGNVPSTFRWNPIDGCQEPATAIRRADAFAASVSQNGVEDAAFWASKASDYLRAYFHAAALAELDLTAVARWVTGMDSTDAETILASSGTATGWQWASQLAELRGEANKTAQTIRMTMSRALAFLADPALAAAAHGRGNSNLPGPAAVLAGRLRRQRHPDHHRRARRSPAQEPVGRRRRTGHTRHLRRQDLAARHQRPIRPRHGLHVVRHRRDARTRGRLDQPPSRNDARYDPPAPRHPRARP